MSINVTFNNYSLQTSQIICERIEYRYRAKRKFEAEPISRRMGKKLVNSQLQEKVIQIDGHLIGTSPTDFEELADEFQKQLSKEEKDLVIQGSRAYTATAERVEIKERTYTQSYAPFSVQFVVAEGFAKDNLIQANDLIPSGILSLNITPTISGTVDNRPLFRFILPSGIGVSTINKIELLNNATGNTLTVSGVWDREDVIAIDFDNYKITHNGSEVDYIGAMDTIETGSNDFDLTISGLNDGTRFQLEYNPRYW